MESGLFELFEQSAKKFALSENSLLSASNEMSKTVQSELIVQTPKTLWAVDKMIHLKQSIFHEVCQTQESKVKQTILIGCCGIRTRSCLRMFGVGISGSKSGARPELLLKCSRISDSAVEVLLTVL